jgi:hypothetical protein
MEYFKIMDAAEMKKEEVKLRVFQLFFFSIDNSACSETHHAKSGMFLENRKESSIHCSLPILLTPCAPIISLNS